MVRKVKAYGESIRRFNGKVFDYEGRSGTRKLAKQHADGLRNQGFKVRVTPIKDWYLIWKRMPYRGKK